MKTTNQIIASSAMIPEKQESMALSPIIIVLSEDETFLSCFEKGLADFNYNKKEYITITARDLNELDNLIENILYVHLVHIDTNHFDPKALIDRFELTNQDVPYLPMLVFWWDEWVEHWAESTLITDTRSRTYISPERVNYISKLNLDRVIQVTELEQYKDHLEQKVKERTFSLSELNLKLKSAVVQNSNHLTRMHQQRIEIEKKNEEIVTQNEELTKSFKRSSLQHIKLQKLLNQNEKQREILEQTLKELQENTEKLEIKNREISEQKNKIEEQNIQIQHQRDLAFQQRDLIVQQQDELKDNICYSRRIQTALLPQDDFIRQLLPQHFIINKPRDIVSGDFYWLTQNRNHTIISVADCTGHGISGAMMSMLGTAFLNEIVNKNDITRTNIILEQLRNRIINSLHQTLKADISHARDGMDMAMCKIDILDLTLEYSGAKNPIYICRKGELIELKPDKMPIGIYEWGEDPFSVQLVDLHYNDMIYMFSDGFADQFGGEKDKKFNYRRFKELLLKVHALPMEEQKAQIENKFNQWKGSGEQIDDVLILGFKIV